MNRMVLGGVATLLFLAAGMFWWQGRAEVPPGIAPPMPELPSVKSKEQQSLPLADVAGLRGPAPPEATELTREQRRFSRYDQNRDGRVSRNEMLSTRSAAFRKLDKDGNNLLTFEEWAHATASKFDKADANNDRELSAAEFATTKPKPAAKPNCKC